MLHGQVKDARYDKSGLSADIYIAGHRHTWGMMTTEMQGRVAYMCCAKDLKDRGEWEEARGFEAEHLDHTITAVLDPDPKACKRREKHIKLPFEDEAE